MDNVARGVHWDICKHFEIECGEKWYERNLETVIKNEKAKILWDFTIQTDKKLPHNRPDIVVVNKMNMTCHTIDVAYPGDSRIAMKEEEK